MHNDASALMDGDDTMKGDGVRRHVISNRLKIIICLWTTLNVRRVRTTTSSYGCMYGLNTVPEYCCLENNGSFGSTYCSFFCFHDVSNRFFGRLGFWQGCDPKTSAS